MATKTYTLAGGTTATVDATENGVPFNEGMGVLTKAIKAKINTSSGGATNKQQPTLSLGEWAGNNNTYSAVISYNGDGVLTANTGTLSGSTITVEDADGNFNGVISAAEGTNFAPSKLVFTHNKETVGGSGKPVPELYVEYFNAFGYSLDETHPITYTGGTTSFKVYVPNDGDKGLGATITGDASIGYKLHVTAPSMINASFILYANSNNDYKEAYCKVDVDTRD